VRVSLPVVGTIPTVVRWWLGGRLGCELESPIELADYYDILAAMLNAR